MFDSKKKRNNSKSITTLLEGSVTNKSPGSILAKLFRKILKETNILHNIEKLIKDYEKNSNKDKSQIQASVLSEDMTWKTFTDNIANLLNVRSFNVSITLVHKVKDEDGNYKVTIHNVEAKPNTSVIREEDANVDKHS